MKLRSMGILSNKILSVMSKFKRIIRSKNLIHYAYHVPLPMV